MSWLSKRIVNPVLRCIRRNKDVAGAIAGAVIPGAKERAAAGILLDLVGGGKVDPADVAAVVPGKKEREAARILLEFTAARETSMNTTPGVKTSEFWVTILAALYNLLIVNGTIAYKDEVVALVSAGATLLVALGYTWARTFAKGKAPAK
jgi:hypothetical protein